MKAFLSSAFNVQSRLHEVSDKIFMFVLIVTKARILGIFGSGKILGRAGVCHMASKGNVFYISVSRKEFMNDFHLLSLFFFFSVRILQEAM